MTITPDELHAKFDAELAELGEHGPCLLRAVMALMCDVRDHNLPCYTANLLSALIGLTADVHGATQADIEQTVRLTFEARGHRPELGERARAALGMQAEQARAMLSPKEKEILRLRFGIGEKEFDA